MSVKEEIVCPICEHKKYTQIRTSGRDYIRTSFAICTKCGFAYQNPRRTKKSILEFYENSYDKLYRPGFLLNKMTDEEYENYVCGFSPLYHRVLPFLNVKEGAKILDVGSGDGVNISYLGRRIGTSNVFAIEPSKAALGALHEKKITVLSNDVDSDWHKDHVNSFDVITLRHVFEHLHYPNQFLQKVKIALKKGGVLYIAVPDAYNLGKQVFSREFSRIVHNYYFSQHSLKNILIKNGFEIKKIQSGDDFHDYELFVTAVRSDLNQKPQIIPDEHDNQLKFLEPFINRDKKLSNKILDFKTYLLRRIYPHKVKLKKSLGFIK